MVPSSNIFQGRRRELIIKMADLLSENCSELEHCCLVVLRSQNSNLVLETTHYKIISAPSAMCAQIHKKRIESRIEICTYVYSKKNYLNPKSAVFAKM